MPHAILVEDDKNSLKALSELVRREGFSTSSARSLADARKELKQEIPDLAVVDLQLPDGSGLELIEELQSGFGAEVVVITGHASVDSAVEALHSGVVDYLVKPVDVAKLKKILANVQRTLQLRKEISDLREELRKLGRFGRMVGASPAMQGVYDLVAKVAPTPTTVLITGETGTGKDMVAQTIHRLSPRSKARFVPVNCGAIQPTLIESELFGHEAGSFTGASRMRRGVFEQASKGTLFLDEITEMPADLQVKLLRVLETGVIYRVGGERPIKVDVRLITATNRSPEKAVQDKKLREDLFYRLMVFPIEVPPLRERREDIEVLANYFLDALNEDAEQAKELTPEALDRLRAHDWPGNVRELRNVIERAFILGGQQIDEGAIRLSDEPTGGSSSDVRLSIGTSIADAERRLILATLEHAGGNKKAAADILGISLKTLYNRLNKYGEGKSRSGREKASSRA